MTIDREGGINKGRDMKHACEKQRLRNTSNSKIRFVTLDISGN